MNLHDGVDKTVEYNEEPDWYGLVLGTTKHRDHGTCVVIRL